MIDSVKKAGGVGVKNDSQVSGWDKWAIMVPTAREEFPFPPVLAWTAIEKHPRLGSLRADIHFLIVLEAGSSRSKWQHSWFLVRTLFLIYRQPPSHYVLTSHGLSSVRVHGERENKFSGVFSYRDTNPIRPGSHSHDLI